MSAKNANNNAENAENGKAAKSMTEHYTLGHKAVAVAMSTVMLGFGVPVNAPKDAYADTDAAAEQPADQDSTAKKSSEDSSSKKAESTKATDSSSAKADSASSSSKASKQESSSSKEMAAKAEEKTTADVALTLGNASIKYQGQTIAAPTTKVTVPTKNAFKFTVAADNGYTLTKVVLKVSGKESTLTADANGTYTVAAADVATGVSIKLVTEQQVQAQPVADVTPIEDTEAETPAASEQPAASDDAAASDEQQSGEEAGSQENAGDQQASEGAADATDESTDTEATDEAQSEESGEAQLQALGNQLISLFAANGATASYDIVVGNKQRITIPGYADSKFKHNWTSTDAGVAQVRGSWSEDGSNAIADIETYKAGAATITDTVVEWYQDESWNWVSRTVATYTYQVTVSEVSVKIVSGPKEIMLGESGTFTCEANVPIAAWLADGDGKGAISPNYQQTTDTEMTFEALRGWNFNGDSITAYIQVQYGNNQLSEPYPITLVKRSFTVDEPPVFTDDSAEHYWVPTLRDAATGEVIDKSQVTNANYEIKYYKDGVYIGNQDDIKSKSHWNHEAGDDAHSLYGPGKYTVEVVSNTGWEYKSGTTTIVVPGKDDVESKTLTANDPNDVAYDGNEHKWAPTVTDKDTGAVLTEGTDYDLSYDTDDFTNPNTITVTITGKGAYKDCTETKVYHILQLAIEGESTVEQFKSIGLTAKVAPDVATNGITWSSSDPSIATIDANGKVTGVKEGKVTITATTVTASGVMLTATHEVTVTKSTAEASDAYLFFQASPTANLDSNVSGDWYPRNGCSSHTTSGLKVKLNTEGVSWFDVKGGKNSYDVSGRVTWADGSTGDSYELPKDNQCWETLFKAWKSQLEKEQNTSISEEDVDSITLIPYKLGFNTSNIGPHYHLDCKVEVKCHKAITAVFYLEDAGSSKGFVQYGEGATYTLDKGVASVQAPKGEFPDVKEVDGVKYKFTGWCSDQACSNGVSFPNTVSSNASYYAKYVPMDQTVRVNYYLEGTTTSVAPSKTVACVKGQTVTESPIDVAGYTPVSTEQKTAIAGTDSEINFYYTANETEYTVNYLWNGTDEKVADSDTVSGSHVGGLITAAGAAEAKGNIANCTVVPDQTASIKLDADTGKNVINVYYYKNVELKANSDTTKEYTGEEQSVSGFTSSLTSDPNNTLEGVDFPNVSAEGKGTDAGEYDVVFSEGAVGAVDTSKRYIVSNTVIGKLTINRSSMKVKVTVVGNKQTVTYNGKEQQAEGYTVSASDDAKAKGFNVDDVQIVGTAVAKGTNAGTYNMGLKGTSFTYNYVGKNFYPENIEYDVTDGSLTIEKRKVNLVSEGGNKPYDGTALTKPGVSGWEESGDTGFVAGEVSDVKVTGSVTNVSEGTVANSITYTEGTGFSAGNYEITKDEGKLYITPVQEAVEVAIVGNTVTDKYDGNAKYAHGYKVGSISNPLYKENDFQFTGNETDKTATGTDAGTYQMGLIKGDFQNLSQNFSNVTFKVTDGSLVINPREVAFTSANDEKQYDGTPLTNSTVTVSGDGFVNGQGVSFDVTGSQTAVGSSENTFTYNWNDGTKAQNYTVAEPGYGTLTVTSRDAKYEITVVANSDKVPYNGKEQSISGLKATEFTVDGHKYTVSGLKAESVPSKNVGTYTNTISGTAVITDEYGNDVSGEFAVSTENGSLTISPRKVTITSKGATKPYDGTPLTMHEIEVTGDGFAEDEGVDVAYTGTITNVGTADNAFTATCKEGTSDSNYIFEYKTGKLEVTPGTGLAKVLTLYTSSFGHYYNGSVHELPASTASASNGSPVVIEYSADDGKTWTTNPSDITAVNVRDSKKVKVRVSSPNYSDTVEGKAELNVTPCVVRLKSKDASKTYDGAPLTSPDVDFPGNKFVDGEVTDLSAVGTITNVGSVKNEISYKTVEGKFLADNYQIFTEPGTLTVTGQSIVPDPSNPDSYKGITIDDPRNVPYDGNEHKWAPTVKDAAGNVLVEGRDYTVSYDKDDFTNVTGDINVTITGMGNYTGTVTKTYKITPVSLTVTTPSASKTYDGTALTANTGTAENIKGLVNGETATVKAKGSQTEVGHSDNTYDGIDWGTAKESNYTVSSVVEGVLTVTPKSITDVEHGMTVGELEDVTYNGNSQEQEPEVKDGNTTLVKGVDYDLSYSEDTTNAGTVTVTVTGKGNYTGSVDRTYQILPAELKVETAGGTKTYDGTPLTAEGITVDGLVNDETVNFKTTGSQTAVGSSENTYAQNWTGTAKQGNYTITEEKLGTLLVTESTDEISVTVTGGEYTYDGTPHGATVAVSGLPTGYRVAEASSDATATDVTKDNDVTANIDHLVIVNAEGQDVTDSLKIKRGEPATIKVNPATLTVATFGAKKAYDGEALTAEGKISGFVNGEEAAFTATGSQTLVGTSKNTYRIDWNGTAKQSNYKIDEKLGDLEVTQNQTSIMVVPQGGAKVYDGNALTSAGVTTYGLPAGYTLSATTFGSQTNVGNSLASVVSYTITNAANEDVTSQFGNVSTGYANLVVTKRPVTLTAQGGTWTYNGEAHQNETVLASTGKDEGFVNGEGFDYSNFASITAVGSVANTFAWKAKNGTDANNYDVKVANQNLVVEAKDINPSAEASMNVDSPSNATYDGREHKWAPTVKDGNTTLKEGADYTVSYSTTDFTNVTGVITVTITGMGNYTGSVTRTYQITPASVTLESNTHEFTYNGTYQSDEDVTVSGADALFKSQVEGLKATGKVKDVAEGKVANTIAYTFKNGFSEKNYTIETKIGELSVKAKDINPSAENQMNVSDPADSVYDGQAHQWAPEVKDGNKVLVEGVDYTVAYSKDDFTNVTGAIEVTITGIGNYTGTVKKSYQITKRDVAVASGSASKVYDGKPLTDSEVFATSYYDFVSGDAAVSATGTVTDPDTVENTIAIAWANDTVSSNYNVTLHPGTLTVSAKSILAKDMTVGTLPDVTYNGLEQVQKPEVKDGDTVLNEGVDYDLSFSNDVTNVGTVIVTVTGKGGYTGSTQVSYRINPATLTVTTPSDSQAYTGEPLTAAGSITGFVNNETATFTTTGSQTTVGSSTNWYSIDWNGTAKQSNYQISESLGTLTVTESENEVVVTTTGETVTYDGKPHGATVVVTNLPAGYTAQATSNASATDVNGEGIVATADNLVIYNTNGEDVTAQLNIKRVDGSIKILPRELTVVTPDASKVYDGEALTAEGSISGFAEGETAAFATTGSQTEEGSSSNSYSLEWNSNAKESNYTLSEQLGTLTVNRQTINPEDPENPQFYDGAQVSHPQDETYNGQEHKWAPTVTDKKGAELVEGTDYTVSYDKNDFTNVTGEITVTITGIGNYSGSVTRTYKINPATYYAVTDGASRAYNGSALTAPGRVVGLVEGEEVSFATTGSQTEVGSSQNGYTLEFDKSAKAGNYTHGTDSIGLLTVEAASVEGAIELTGTPVTETYDGTAHSAGTATATVSTPDEVTIEYSLDGTNWTTDPSTITATNVDDSATVQLRASSPKNYTGYAYGSEALTINKRTVNLASEGGSKTYDGTALTKPEVSGWQQNGDEGFVAGEVSDVRATGSVLNVGDTATNTIEYTEGVAFAEGNYAINKDEGELSITGQSINPDDEDSYLGIEITSPDDVEYDGAAHEWAPTVTDKDGNELVAGRDYAVSYPEGQDFTNVTGAITATITGIGNYTGTVTRSYQVTPKQLTVTTDSATKVYDGTPLTAPGHIEGLVEGETADVLTPNSQTEVGSMFNFATNIVWGTAQERNYTWTIGEIGTLTVTAQSIVPDPQNPDSYKGITVDDPTDSVYDGQEHKWAPVVKDAAGNELVEGRDYTVSFDKDDFTNVTGAITATITGVGNYTGSVSKSYQITPAQLTVATGSAEKQYDGTPLTNSQMEISGLVGGDAVTARTTGSQTEVGSSANTYEITWGSTLSSNYAITSEELGTLTVTEAPATPVEPTTPGGTVTPNQATTPTNPVIDNVARVLEGGINTITGSNDNAAAVAAGEQIFDEENPLGTTTYEDVCWVHFYIILGMILSGIYGLGVMFRRLNHIRRLRNDMNDVMGSGSGTDPEKAPTATTNPAGMEA